MRHENRYFFAHLFGFAGLTVDEHLHAARALLHIIRLAKDAALPADDPLVQALRK